MLIVTCPNHHLIRAIRRIHTLFLCTFGRLSRANVLIPGQLKEYLTRGDRDMSVKITFCRGFLEHVALTLTNEIFQVVIVWNIIYYLHIERKSVRKKGIPLISGRFC